MNQEELIEMRRELTYCNQCGFAGDDEDFVEHIEEEGHTGYKKGVVIRHKEDYKEVALNTEEGKE